MRPNHSLEQIGIAALSIILDNKSGKNTKLNVYQLSKKAQIDRRLIYYHLNNLKEHENHE